MVRLALIAGAAVALAACEREDPEIEYAFNACEALLSEAAEWGIARMDTVEPTILDAASPQGEDQYVFNWTRSELQLSNGYGANVPYDGRCSSEVVNSERRVQLSLDGNQGRIRCDRSEPASYSRDSAMRRTGEAADDALRMMGEGPPSSCRSF